MRLGAENTAGLPDLREQVEFGVEEETRPMATDAPPYARLRGPNQWPNEIDCPRFRGERVAVLGRGARALDATDAALGAVAGPSRGRVRRRVRGRAKRADENREVPAAEDRLGATTADRRERNANANENENDDAAAFGVGAHTDSGFLSLLLQDDVGGLQVMNGAGEWVDAPPVENTLVVNLGEMLQLATRAGTTSRRRTECFFRNPRWSAEYGTSTARVSASRTSGTRGWSTCASR